jgi:hypothetical protein
LLLDRQLHTKAGAIILPEMADFLKLILRCCRASARYAVWLARPRFLLNKRFCDNLDAIDTKRFLSRGGE